MEIPKHYITSEEDKLIKDTNALVVASIESYFQWREALLRPRVKTAFAVSSLLLLAKNSASAVDCIKAGHVDAARGILRINVETFINMLYVFTKPLNAAYVRLGYSAEMQYLANIDKYEVFTNATYTGDKLTPDDFDSFRKPFKKAKQQWEEMNHGIAIKNVPDLRTRCDEIKKQLGIVWASELYFNSYLFLSEDIHATPSSIISMASREDFEEMWFGVQAHKSIRDTLKIQSEILATTMFFLNKRVASFGLDNPLIDRQLIANYNRHKVYQHFIER